MTFKPAHLLVVLLVTAFPAMAQNLATVNGKAIPASKAEPFVKQALARITTSKKQCCYLLLKPFRTSPT